MRDDEWYVLSISKTPLYGYITYVTNAPSEQPSWKYISPSMRKSCFHRWYKFYLGIFVSHTCTLGIFGSCMWSMRSLCLITLFSENMNNLSLNLILILITLGYVFSLSWVYLNLSQALAFTHNLHVHDLRALTYFLPQTPLGTSMYHISP